MSYIAHETDHNCCDGGCAQGDECPLYRAPAKRRSPAEFPYAPGALANGPGHIFISTEGGGGGGPADSAYAPGRLGTKTYEDVPDPPLGWRGWRALIALLLGCVALGGGVAWLVFA